LSYAAALQAQLDLPVGALRKNFTAMSPKTPRPARQDMHHIEVVVCGAHMLGLPLNGQLLSRHATLVCNTKTKNAYRLFVLPGSPPLRPGLIRDAVNGNSIDVEVWRVPVEEFGSFIALIPAPLGIGKVELADG